ncbi:MAG: propionyl-CoA synthetase, partial [Bacteroidetes bacterium]
MNFNDFYQSSIQTPEKFWGKESKSIEWYRQPASILSKNNNGYHEWFKGGKLNTCFLCVDKHIINGYGRQTAVIYDSPVTQTIEHISYYKLLEEVSRLAGGLKTLGVKKGDTVLIYMPMIPQAIYAMLACARLGAIHSVVFGGFAPHELAIRIEDSEAKVIITASNGIEVSKIIEYKPIIDAAIEESTHKPSHVILFDREQNIDIPHKPYDIDYTELVANSQHAAPVEVEATDPLYILYTSGTTGKPKGVIRDNGGHAVALKFSMKNIYGIDEGETFWAASDIGWVVGHSYIVYGPLLNRNTTILLEGKPVKTPDASTFWRVIDEHKVKVMFTAPTAIRAIKREDPKGDFTKKYDLSGLRYLFLAGERCDAATLAWAEEQLQVPVIDHWWQTESGWPMIANMAGFGLQPVKPGSATLPVCGYDIRILDASGKLLTSGNEGYVAVKLPLPPGNMLGLWRDPAKFQETYLSQFEGYYFSGDGGYKDEDGYVFITGRIDDIINVAGHRLSTADMEEIVASHPSVAECAVFGVHCDLKGEKPMGLVVLKAGETIDHNVLQHEIVQEVRATIGAVASFKEVVVVKHLPKTRS